ncbi:hypothetical protein DM480_12130 [Sphingomonas sp. FARSPH]|nr:hypothetical protein DM480_12130 [Sphingomonas sp. FARSPH]
MSSWQRTELRQLASRGSPLLARMIASALSGVAGRAMSSTARNARAMKCDWGRLRPSVPACFQRRAMESRRNASNPWLASRSIVPIIASMITQLRSHWNG